VVTLVLLGVLAQAREQGVECGRRHQRAVDRDVGLAGRREAVEKALIQRPARPRACCRVGAGRTLTVSCIPLAASSMRIARQCKSLPKTGRWHFTWHILAHALP